MTGLTAVVERGGPANPNMEGMTPWTVRLRYQGREMLTPFYTGSALGEPTADEVMECLLSDACGIENADGFEDWAESYGYDTDSRNAERTYNAALEQTDRLRELLGGDFHEAVYGDAR